MVTEHKKQSIRKLEAALKNNNLIEKEYFEGIFDALLRLYIVDNYFGYVKSKEKEKGMGNSKNSFTPATGNEDGRLLAALIIYLPNIKDKAYIDFEIFDKSEFNLLPLTDIDFEKHIEEVSAKSKDGAIVFDKNHMADKYIVFDNFKSIAVYNITNRINGKKELVLIYKNNNIDAEKLKKFYLQRFVKNSREKNSESGKSGERNSKSGKTEKIKVIKTIDDALQYIAPATFSDPEGKKGIHAGSKSESAFAVPIAFNGAVSYMLRSTVFKNNIGKVVMCGRQGVIIEGYLDNITGLENNYYIDKEKAIVIVKQHYKYYDKKNSIIPYEKELVTPYYLGIEKLVEKYSN